MLQHPPVILASSSTYRRELLRRILPEFEIIAPAADETALADEAPEALARRLAAAKTAAVAAMRPDAIVIGSDQVPALDSRLLRKPGGHARAIAQLNACSGRTVEFYTAVEVAGPDRANASFVDRTTVHFRSLTTGEIERYIDKERPYDCAGSFRVEGLGICLFKAVESSDPTALQGLPLIELAVCLNRFGIPLP